MVSPVLGALWPVLGQVFFREFALLIPRTKAGAVISTAGRNRSELAQDQLPFFLLSCNPLEFCFDCPMRVTLPGPVRLFSTHARVEGVGDLGWLP